MDKGFQSRSKSNKTFSETSSNDGSDSEKSDVSSPKKKQKDFAADPALWTTPTRQETQQQTAFSHQYYHNTMTDRMWPQVRPPIPNRDTSSHTRSSGIDSTGTVQKNLNNMRLQSDMSSADTLAQDTSQDLQTREERQTFIKAFLDKQTEIAREIQALGLTKKLPEMLQKCDRLAQLTAELKPFVTRGLQSIQKDTENYKQYITKHREELDRIQSWETELKNRKTQKDVAKEDFASYWQDINESEFFTDLIRHRADEVTSLEEQVGILEEKLKDKDARKELLEERIETYNTKIAKMEGNRTYFQGALNNPQQVINYTLKKAAKQDHLLLDQFTSSSHHLGLFIDEKPRSDTTEAH